MDARGGSHYHRSGTPFRLGEYVIVWQMQKAGGTKPEQCDA